MHGLVVYRLGTHHVCASRIPEALGGTESHGGTVSPQHVVTAHRAHQRQWPSVCSSMYRRRTNRTRSKRERPSTPAPHALPHMRNGGRYGRERVGGCESGWRGGSQSRRRCGARVTTASKTRSSKAITTSKCSARAAHLHPGTRGELNSARQRRSGSADGARPAAAAAAVLRRVCAPVRLDDQRATGRYP